MASECYKATAPGSLMLMGEYAVLYGYPAIVAAIDKFLTVELLVEFNTSSSSKIIIYTDIEIADNKIELTASDLKANISLLKDKIKNYKYYEYVIHSIFYFKQYFLDKIDNKIYIFKISSGINPNMGLGSSAAVVAAVLSVITQCFKLQCKLKLLLEHGHSIIKQVQGGGSGADLAASLYGGVISYQLQDDNTPSIDNKTNYKVEKISDYISLTIVYSGYKLSTKEAISKISNQSNSKLFNQLLKDIESLTLSFKNKFNKRSNIVLGDLFNQHYKIQQQMGVSDDNLNNIIEILLQDKNIYGAKISGSGLGDCIIGLGQYKQANNKLNIINAKVTDQGLEIK